MTDMNEGFFTEPDNEEKPKNELPDIEIPEDDIPVYAHDSEKQKRSDAGYRVSQRGNVSQHRRRSRFVCFCVPVIISCALLCCILPAGIFGGVAALAAVAD
ncbi:MAG TPA: hypothetical protein VJZ27_19655, partial [Aggregatilineales bacterium]|nr:hypothetical protein [Aggregatilineales bacterium]